MSRGLSTARLFFVRGLPSSYDDCETSPASLTYAELPPLPISAGFTSGASALEARPLVSPMLHLGRQSPLLCTALHNDRRWSRKLLEVTTWCIDGLATTTTSGNLCPIDDAALPFAGVRIRLCGKGGPIRVIPRSAAGERRGTVLSEAGACAWLQHGDAVDFGAGVQLRFLAVHLRISPACALAQNASFLWVQPSSDAQATAPVAMWSARFTDWSRIPKFLKAKMLLEAAQLVQQTARQEEEHWRLSATAATMAPTSDPDKNSASQRLNEQVKARVDASGHRSPAPFLLDSGRSSEARPDACTEGEAFDVEAATPTSESQQRQQQRLALTSADSPQGFSERGRTRSAPDFFGGVSDARTTALGVPSSASQGRSPPLVRAGGSDPRPRPSSLSVRASVNLARYSCATLSETMDDKLHEALLNLENGGNDVGEALVLQRQQLQHEPAVLLGAMEDELSGPRAASRGNGTSHQQLSTSPPTRWEEEEDGTRAAHGGGPHHRPRRSNRRSGRGKVAGRGSGLGADDGDGELLSSSTSPRKLRRTQSVGGSLSQPMRKGGVAGDVLAPPLTRADIRRRRENQSAEEDSQVVFFDH